MNTHITVAPPGEPISLFISDTHLFHRRNAALDVQGLFIEQTPAHRLYLLGDIIDYEYIQDLLVDQMEIEGIGLQDIPEDFEDVLSMLEFFDLETHLRFLDIIMAQVDNGTQTHYLTGNHDNNLDILHEQTRHGITFHDHIVEEFGGIPTHLEHGDENDPGALQNYNGLYATGGKILDAGLAADHALRGVFNRISPDNVHYPFPITNSLKTVGKAFISTFRENAIKRAKERGAQATVLGHIHKQEIRKMPRLDDENPEGVPIFLTDQDGFRYRNTGDGLTHGTALMYSLTK